MSVSTDQFLESVALYHLLQVAAAILYIFANLMVRSIDLTCHVHPVGDPEWTTDFLNFSDKEMCPKCIICQDFPEPPPVIGYPLEPFEDARFMEWYKSWPDSVTDSDRANCVC